MTWLEATTFTDDDLDGLLAFARRAHLTGTSDAEDETRTTTWGQAHRALVQLRTERDALAANGGGEVSEALAQRIRGLHAGGYGTRRIVGATGVTRPVVQRVLRASA